MIRYRFGFEPTPKPKPLTYMGRPVKIETSQDAAERAMKLYRRGLVLSSGLMTRQAKG